MVKNKCVSNCLKYPFFRVRQYTLVIIQKWIIELRILGKNKNKTQGFGVELEVSGREGGRVMSILLLVRPSVSYQ